jgi:hypothetical protein
VGCLWQGPIAATSKVEDVDGRNPGGCWRQGLTAATTEVEDVDGGPPGGAGSKVRQRPPPKLKTSMAVPLGGAGGKVRYRPPPKLKTSMAGSREVQELEIRDHNAFGAHPSGRAVIGCRSLGTNAQRVVRIDFTLTQVGHLC